MLAAILQPWGHFEDESYAVQKQRGKQMSRESMTYSEAAKPSPKDYAQILWLIKKKAQPP